MKLAFFHRILHRNFSVWLLAFLWTFSLIAGFWFCSGDPHISSLMRLAPDAQVSIVGLCCVLFLPVLISAASLYWGRPAVIYLICSVKAFISGYGIYAVLGSFGSSGWLLHILVLFSDTCINLVLLWLWFRNILIQKSRLLGDSLIGLSAAGLIGIADYLLVSPFLATLAGIL